MKKNVNLVVAVAQNGVIGKNNQLIWKLGDDMKFFKELTWGNIVLTGRKNFESIPEKFRPLPNRLNCIMTRNKAYLVEECIIFSEIEGWIETFQHDERDLFIIGGGEIYLQAIERNLVDVMYVTHVHANVDGDTFFPKIDPSHWQATKIGSGLKNDKNDFDFDIVKYTHLKE
jgi:dihydrofolate reductase